MSDDPHGPPMKTQIWTEEPTVLITRVSRVIESFESQRGYSPSYLLISRDCYLQFRASVCDGSTWDTLEGDGGPLFGGIPVIVAPSDVMPAGGIVAVGTPEQEAIRCS